MLDRTWLVQAKCRHSSPENFVLDEKETGTWLPATQRDMQADHLCAGCPVKKQCAIDAIEHEDIGVVRAGVWLPDHAPKGSYVPRRHNTQKLLAVINGTKRNR